MEAKENLIPPRWNRNFLPFDLVLAEKHDGGNEILVGFINIFDVEKNYKKPIEIWIVSRKYGW